MQHGSGSFLATNNGHAGLGNRMRFTLSALSLAEAHDRDFAYAWPKNDHFRPALTDLWEFKQREIPWSQAFEIAKETPWVPRWEDLPVDANALPLWHIRSADALTLPEGAPLWTQRLRELTPTPAIRARISSLHAEYLKGAPYIGVMIRAHEKSHAKTVEASPVEWFLERMAELNRSYPGIRFFISCDVPEVQDRIIDAFPNSVGQSDKGEYNSTEGVVSSVVDLYLLAASSYMIVPYYSSFPTMAWELAERKVVMENSRSGRKDLDISGVQLASDPLRPASRANAPAEDEGGAIVRNMEKKLLDLSAEYAAVKESIDMYPDQGAGYWPRTLDQIAAEYGAALREFLADG